MTRLGMIGCGLISRAHGLAAERSNRDVEFGSCSSRSIESANAFANEFGCNKVYPDHQALLDAEELDGIVIAAPPAVHLEIIQDCLAAGIKYILCEKPLTLDAGEAQAVATAAKRAGATVLEALQYRHHPQTGKLIELIDSGDLGEVDQVYCSVSMLDSSELDGTRLPDDWRRSARLGGGVLHDFLCYPIDLASQLIKARPARAFARSFLSPTYGTVYRIVGIIEYDNGAVATVTASRLTDFSEPLFVGCTSGSLTIGTCLHPTGNSEIVVQRSEDLVALNKEVIKIEVPTPVSSRLIDMTVFTWQLEHFVDLIDGRGDPIISLEESVTNSCVRDALIASGNTETWQPVNCDDTSHN